MKALLFIIGTLGAGLIGFMYEPSMRMQLTGKEPGRLIGKENDSDSKRPVVIDLSKWPKDRLPEKVKLKDSAQVTSKTNNLKLTVDAGNEVVLVSLEGDKVSISTGPDGYDGVVLVSQTDLVEQIQELSKSGPVDSEIVDKPVQEDPEDPFKPEVPDPVVPETPVAVVPEEPAAPQAPVAPEVVDTPDPVVEPEQAASPAASSEEVVSLMKASVKAGDIQEFTLEQVLNWDANEGQEVVDGVSYQTGSISYKKDTPFGEKTVQAKALIQNGKVVKWIWVKSGMVIK